MTVELEEAGFAGGPGRFTGDRRAYALLTTTALCWAANVVIGKFAIGEVSPLVLVTVRWIVVLTLLLGLARRQIAMDLPLLKKHWLFMLSMGALGYAAFNAMLYTAAHHTSAVNIGILQGSLPVFVLLLAALALRSTTSWLQVSGVFITLVGAGVVATGGSLERLLRLSTGFGDLLMILACLLFAGYTLALRRRPDVSALGMFAALALGAFVASAPMLATEFVLGGSQWPTRTGWLLILFSAVVPSITGQICFMQGVQLIGPKRAGVFVNMVPVFASVFAVVLLRESFELFHAVALSLVLAGIWLSERSEEVT